MNVGRREERVRVGGGGGGGVQLCEIVSTCPFSLSLCPCSCCTREKHVLSVFLVLVGCSGAVLVLSSPEGSCCT